MGFKVYQGEVKDPNLLPVTRDNRQVAVTGSGDKLTIQMKAPEGKGAAQVLKQAADDVTVFVNEKGKQGRDVIVVWDGSSSAAATVAAPRTQPTTVGTPGPGQWLVTRDDDSIRDSKIDAAFQAVTPSGWQTGPSVKFTTSNCGLDSFIVTYRYAAAGKPKFAHVVVSVHKRLHCHLSEMKRSAKPGDTDTIDDFRTPLAEAQKVFASFGIDLVFSGGKIAPERSMPFLPTRTNAQLKAMLPEAAAAGRSPTDLWINVVNAINGTEDGLGGQSQVHVETEKNLTAKRAYESWQSSWEAAKGKKTKDEWVKTFKPEDQKLARQLASEAITAEEISRLNMRTLLLHEIGHALGLVPTDEKAGGADQSSWQDGTHAGHCATKTCVMFWESGSATRGLEAQLRSQQTPFDHVPAFMATKQDEEKCMLFLRACDLSDIRKLPI